MLFTVAGPDQRLNESVEVLMLVIMALIEALVLLRLMVTLKEFVLLLPGDRD